MNATSFGKAGLSHSKIMNIVALNVLKISGSFWKSGKNALRIYPPKKELNALLRPWLLYGWNFFFSIKL